MYSKSKSLQYVLFVCLIIFSFSVAVASAEVSTVLYDGNAAEFASAPDVIAFANTAYVAPPSEFQITTGGNIWRYNHVIALMEQGNWVEAKTTVETTTVGVQFWGDSNDGWARVLVDGEEVWTGDTYGNHLAGDAFIKYLEISGLEKGVHTIRVENMGVAGPGGLDHVTIYFFGLVAPSPVSSTPTQISEKGLVAYYPFDNDVRDYSGNNNHGTSQGNMAFSTGVVGSAAASFDGASYVEVQDSDSLDLTGDFTFSVWLNKIDAGVGGWAVVLSKGDTSSISATDSPYAMFHYNGVYPGLRIDRQYVSSDSATNYNEWYLVTVTREGNEFKFYINGELKDTKTSTAATPASTSKLLIGTDPPGVTEYFKGYMDDLRIYDYALSQSEVSSIYGGGGTAPATGDASPSSTVAFSGLTFESRSKATGSSVQIPLTLYGVRENIGNMDMTLRYDSSVLRATEVVKGSLTGDSIFDYNIIDGTIRISLADKDGFYGDGSVAQVRFDVIGSEGSFSDLDIASLSANRADLTSVSIATRDGVFKVTSKEISKGDAEGDGGVLTALDALYALQMAVGKIPEDLTMDMNGDGSVTSIDARQILKSSAKIE